MAVSAEALDDLTAASPSHPSVAPFSPTRGAEQPRCPAGIPPEAWVVFLSAGGEEAEASIIEALPLITDWHRMAGMSVSHGAHPVFLRHVRIPADSAAAPTVAALIPVARTAELRLQYLERRLGEALTALSAHGIPVMLLKGAAMSRSIHRGVSERPMSDADVLVRPEDAVRARELLLGSGWAPRFPEELDGLYQEMHHLPPLTDARLPAMRAHLEIHTEILPPRRSPFRLAAGDFWVGALPAPGLPAGVFVPSVMHRLLHCCVHFAWSHMFEKSAWRTFRDIAALSRSGLVDWGELDPAADDARAVTCCHWTLRLARDLSGARVPGWVIDRLGSGTHPLLQRPLERYLARTAAGLGQGRTPGWARRRLWELAIAPRSSGHRSLRPWTMDSLPWHLLEAPGRQPGGRPIPTT